MDWYVEEKRCSPRCNDGVCAWLSFFNEPAVYASLTVDIGLRGARFSTHRRVRKGEAVDLHLQLPAGAVQCSGSRRTPVKRDHAVLLTPTCALEGDVSIEMRSV